MASYLNRRQENTKTNSRISDPKSMKLMLQPRKTKAQTIRAEKNKLIEKRVVNSLTELIGSKGEEDYKNTMVFKILVKNIMKHLKESGQCTDEQACLATAKKMAAFVSDIMKETYKKQRLTPRNSHSRGSSASLGRDDRNRARSREPLLPRIPEERIKRVVKSAERKKETKTAPPSSMHKTEIRTQVRTPPSSSKTSPRSGAQGNTTAVKADKEKLNSWLDDVGNRTKKWTEWIRDTVEKAENSKNRVKSGESLRSVSEDWKKFVHGKRQESKAINQSSSNSNIWKNNNEAYRRRGEESIQQWLVKNKLNSNSGDHYNFNNRDQSNYSVRTASSESLYSVWSSRAPSSLGGDSELFRLKQMGMFM